MRVFAGPNGSGKSTLFREFKKYYNPGYFINADELEALLSKGLVSLSEIGLQATTKDLNKFKTSKEAESLLKKASSEGKVIDIEVRENFIVDRSKDTHSYEAAFAASFIRHLLIENGHSFSFETVMSHSSKLKEIEEANRLGYKTYLYFVCTDNPQINVDRVANRVDKGGHNVDPEKIRSRYTHTLENLLPAIRKVHRAYLFDNSGKQQTLIAEVLDGKSMKIMSDQRPDWFDDYVLNNW